MHIPKTKSTYHLFSCFPHWSIRQKAIIPQYIGILRRHYHSRYSRDPLFIDQNKEISKVTTWTTCRIWTRWPNRGRVDSGFWLFMNVHCSHSTSRHICEELNVRTSVMKRWILHLFWFVLYIGVFGWCTESQLGTGGPWAPDAKKNQKQGAVFCVFYWWLFFCVFCLA